MLKEILKERDYLPILKLNDGTTVTSENWQDRRKELLEILEKYSYGHTPNAEIWIDGLFRRFGNYNCGGKCTEEHIDIMYGVKYGDGTKYGKDYFPIQLFTPTEVEKPPVFLLLAFEEAPSRFIPVESIIDAGYALAVVDYKKLVNDNGHGDFSDGIAKQFGMSDGEHREEEEWGKIGMWAWGASRVLDYLIRDKKNLDTSKVAVIGHSRLGKAALWCGAQDERFAAVISNNSGYGGASSSKCGMGERITDYLNAGSWEWFCNNFKKFAGELEDKKPYDQSFLSALIAPRYLLVGSAEQDWGADPTSAFLTTLHASCAWEILGEKGLVTEDKMPEPGDFLGEGNILYHYRKGRHYLSLDDWKAYIKFLDDKFKKR